MDNSTLNNLSDNLSDNLYMLLLSLNRRVLNPADLVKRFNIPHSHVRVLFYLIHNGSTAISKIAKDLCISKPNMTPVLDKLNDEGLIRRYYDPHDRRIIRIEATEKACDFLKQIKEYTKQMLEEKISTLSSEEIKTLSESTQNMLNIFSKF